MKAKSLHFSKSGCVQEIAAELGRVYECVCDKIPPAYPCEGEKVVFVGVEMNGRLDKQVESFCRDLTPARAKNVALYIVNNNGNTSGLDDIKATVENKGVHFVDDILGISVKSGLFKKGKPTEEDIQKVVNWAKDVIENKCK